MIPANVKALLDAVYGTRWGEAYIEWSLFNAKGGGFNRDPAVRDFGRAATAAPPDDKAVFWTAGLLKAGGGRSNKNVERMMVFVMDDVGFAPKSKISPLDLLGLPEPTIMIESSPGNFQWQWGITDGMMEDEAAALRASLPVKSDATAPSNLIRLPMGVSGKVGVIHKVTGSALGPVYLWADFVRLCGGYKVTVAAVHKSRAGLEAPDIGHVEAALKALPNDGVSVYCRDYLSGWITLGMALYGATGGRGFDLWEKWNEPQPQKRDLQEVWDSFYGTHIGWVKLRWLAREQGSGYTEAVGALAQGAFDDDAEAPAIAGAPDAKQLRYALEVVRRFGARIRYNFDRGAWHLFDGCIWEPLPTKRKLAFELSMGVAMMAPPGSAAILNASFHDGVENFCRQSGTLHAREADFDRDPWLLGTPGGTVDLRTGALVPARASDMIAKSAAVAPGGACPRWNKFIAEICGNDLAAMEYLQQYAGYCLTGETSEQVFLFLHGSGGNGKSVFADTLMAVMGDYAVKPVGDLFIKKAHGVGHTSKLAMLAGARLCTVSEVPSGAQWDEGLLKDITGGGTMTAGFKHKDEFTFAPRFKLLALGNNQPSFPGGINPAIRRRFRMMEFAFQPKVVDKDLMEKLRGEWGGILSWMMAGCLKWQKTGLITPDAVDTATAGFFADSDLLGQWIASRLEKVPGALGDATDLFRDWIDFRNLQGNHELFNNQTAFGREMTEVRGFVKGRTSTSRGYKDVRLRARGLDVFDDEPKN